MSLLFSRGASGASFNFIRCVELDIEAGWSKMRSKPLKGLTKVSKSFGSKYWDIRNSE